LSAEVNDKSVNNGQNRRKFQVLELFCGCGGFSHGFLNSGDFEIACGIDMKPAALETFRRNHPNLAGEAPEIIKGDIREIEIGEIQSRLEKRGIASGQLDCLIGGPPCQGFSQLRRSKERERNAIVRFRGYDRLDQDPRNDLVLRFLEIAAVLRPKIIVIENVPQMMKHVHNGVDGGIAIQIMNLLKEMKYETKEAILNAADFGVPQIRERVFIMASRIGAPVLPAASYGDSSKDDLIEKNILPWVTVGEAISDLPAAPSGPQDSLGGGSLSTYPAVNLSRFAKKMRGSRRFPYNHLTRKYEKTVISIIQNMKPGETWDDASARMQSKYARLIDSEKHAGESELQCQKRLIAEGLIIPAFEKQYYWSAYTRLDRDRPALTITANANFLGSGRFTHPQEDRGITMREAARLQSFEDEFTFLTSADAKDLTTNIGVGLDMIGEAVPPLLAEAVARQVQMLLAGLSFSDIKSSGSNVTSPPKLSKFQKTIS
jgi:DNA (cytosine-5)-methyltransferase 1